MVEVITYLCTKSSHDSQSLLSDKVFIQCRNKNGISFDIPKTNAENLPVPKREEVAGGWRTLHNEELPNLHVP
jgi:hypothetical protein